MTIPEIIAELRRQSVMRNATWPCMLLKDLMPLCDEIERLTALPPPLHPQQVEAFEGHLGQLLKRAIADLQKANAENERLRGFFIYDQDGAMGGLNVMTLGQLIALAPSSAFQGSQAGVSRPATIEPLGTSAQGGGA